MAKEIKKLQVEALGELTQKVQLKALGNSHRKLMDVATDLIHASGKRWKDIADGAFLAPSTVKNLAEGKTQLPRADTIERLFTFFDMRVDLVGEVTLPQYRNTPKHPDLGRRK